MKKTNMFKIGDQITVRINRIIVKDDKLYYGLAGLENTNFTEGSLKSLWENEPRWDNKAADLERAYQMGFEAGKKNLGKQIIDLLSKENKK